MTYANINEVKAGVPLVADGGFTCLTEGDVLTVSDAGGGDLYVPCRCGRHFLNGQVGEDGKLIGLSHPEI